MLVLSRRPGEAVLLGGGIRIVVLDSSRRGVRLGIDAPRELIIRRAELVEDETAAQPEATPSEPPVS